MEVLIIKDQPLKSVWHSHLHIKRADWYRCSLRSWSVVKFQYGESDVEYVSRNEVA